MPDARTPQSTSKPTTPVSRSRSSSSGPRTAPSRPRSRPGPGGDNEFVFYDGPPFANGLPHYGHLLTGFVKDAVPRYQTMRGRRVERRFGWDCHGLPGRDGGREGARGLAAAPAIIEYGIDRFNDYCRDLGAAHHRRLGALRHPPGPLGRLRQRLQDHGPLLHGERHVGLQDACWDKGLVYEGERVLPYCWECETPLSNFETRQDDAYRPARTRPSRSCSTLEPRRRRRHRLPRSSGPLRLLAWTTTPWTLPSNLALAVGPDIDVRRRTSSLGEPTVIAASRAGGLPRALRRAPSSWPRSRAGARRAHLPTAVRLLRRPHRAPSGSSPATSSPPTRAPASSTWRRASARRTTTSARRPGIAVVCPVDDQGRFTAEVPTYAGLQVFDANAPIIERPAGGRGRWSTPRAYTHSYPHCWRTDTPLIYKAVELVVREGHRHQGPHGRAQPGDRLGPDARPRRRLRQVARGGARLVHQPQPLLGSAHPGVEERRPRATPASTSTAASTSSSATSACVPTTCTAPPSTSSSRPNPDDPTGPVDHAAGDRRPRLLVRVRVDALRPGPLPLRERRVVRVALPRRLHRRVRGPDPRLVLHPARAWPPPCSTDRPFRPLHRPRRRPRRRRPQDVEAPGELPRARHGLRHRGAPTPCAGSCCPRRSCGARTCVVHAKGIEEVRRQVLNPIWNAWYFLSLYANVDGIRGRCRTDADRRARPLHPGQDRRARSTTSPPRWTATTSSRRLRRHHRVSRRPQQLVHPPQPRPLLARPRRLGRGRDGQGRRLRHLVHRARHAVHGRGAAAAAADRGGLPGPHRANAASTWPTGPRRLRCPPTPSWSRPWTSSATCARPAHAIRKAKRPARPPAAAPAHRGHGATPSASRPSST